MELALGSPINSKLIRPLWQHVSGIARLSGAVLNGYRLAFKGDALKNPGQPGHQKLVSEFCQGLCNALGFRLEVHGDIPDQPALWVSNHISWADVAVIGTLIPAFFLAKIEVKSWPVLGHLAEVGGTLFIRRGSGDSGSVKSQLAEMLKKQISLIIFPEATTTDGTYIKKVHGKLLPAAAEAGTPIQPVVIAYVRPDGQLDRNVPFIDDTTFAANLSQILTMPKPVTAHLMVLPAIDPAGKTREEMTAELQQVMTRGLQDLHGKILQPASSL